MSVGAFEDDFRLLSFGAPESYGMRSVAENRALLPAKVPASSHTSQFRENVVASIWAAGGCRMAEQSHSRSSGKPNNSFPHELLAEDTSRILRDRVLGSLDVGRIRRQWRAALSAVCRSSVILSTQYEHFCIRSSRNRAKSANESGQAQPLDTA